MFDIGFWEIFLIGVIGLIVIGPERLPGVARTVGFWLGKTKRFISSVQQEFSDEINKADELQRRIKQEMEIKELHEAIELDESKPTVPVTNKRNKSSEQLSHEDTHGKSMPVTGAAADDKEEKSTPT